MEGAGAAGLRKGHTNKSVSDNIDYPESWGSEQCPQSTREKDKPSPGKWRRGTQNTESSPGQGEAEALTQRGYKCKVLQHHTVVQPSLSLIKKPPFLPGEVHGNVLKGHTTLP